MRRLTLIAAWSLVLLVTTSLTWQIVSAADDRTSDRPVSPLNVSAPVVAAGSPSTSEAPASSTSSGVDQGTTSTVPAVPQTTQTTILEQPEISATTTSSPQVPWVLKSIPTQGGVVVVKYRTGEVVLQAATPAPGFTAEIEKSGPPEVRVEFESETTKVEVRAEWEDGDLSVSVSESDEND